MRLLVFISLTVLLFTSCGEKSTVGHWTNNDKNAARAELEGIRSSIKTSMGSQSDQFIECYMETLERSYANFEDASNDYDGRARLAVDCARVAKQVDLSSIE
ncbi:MAG: hypothetical protein ACO2Z9_00765 [Crocinitomicaceae bacterium]